MYLVDTDVISEARKADQGNAAVRAYFSWASEEGAELYLSAVTIGELRQGVERIRHRGDKAQAQRLEQWLLRVTSAYADRILPLDEETGHIWGCLRVPNPENPLGKQIAATALIHDLEVISRNVAHYAPTGVRVRNPFT
jgi:predicted nucleic acid-binding protein